VVADAVLPNCLNGFTEADFDTEGQEPPIDERFKSAFALTIIQYKFSLWLQD
jgi:hypothetical protein